MRVPISSPPNNQPSDPKPTSNNNNNNNNNNSNNAVRTSIGFNEPTSVLDLRASPSPAGQEKTAAPVTDVSAQIQHVDQLHLDEHVMRSMDWDSIMRELELDDDSAAILKGNIITTNAISGGPLVVEPQLPGFPDQLHPPDFDSSDVYANQNPTAYNQENLVGFNSGFDFIEDLLRVAECIDTNELQLAQVVLARLNQNQRLRSPVGRPLQRAAFYFKEALQTLLTGSNPNPTTRLSSWSDIVQTIKAYKAFSAISPVPLFAHFTANQAILDSLINSQSSLFIHVIDFDIGFGGHYASLMKEIADKSINGGLFIRVTAVVPEEFAVETRLIKENLTLFAQDLKIRFQIEFVLMRTFEMLSFKSIRFVEGERTAVLLSPVIFHRLSGNISGFASDLRRISPNVVVLIDGEGWNESSGAQFSFRREFVNALEFYTTILESLDAAAAVGDWVKKIEAFVLRPRILSAVEAAAVGRRDGAVGVMTWRAALAGAGLRPVALSQFADFQAECLLGKVQVRGFQVAKRQADLVLCWQGRALVATSAWRF